MKLTDATIQRLNLPDGETDRIFFDEKLAKFGIRLRGGKTLRKTWIIQYRDAAGATRRFTIGTSEELNAAKARETAADKLAEIRLGDYPHAERKKARDLAVETFDAVGEKFLADVKARLRNRSYEEVERHITKLWAPLARTSIHHINQRSIAHRLAEITANSGPVAANRARASLSSMFGWAMRRGIVSENPVVNTEKAIEVARERVLTDSELDEIWSACRDDDHGRIVRLLILTGQRREEVGGMQWDEVDLCRGEWCLPSERTKNGRAHKVALAPMAVSLLHAAPRRERPDGAIDHVFGAGEGGFSGWSKAKAALDSRITDSRAKAVRAAGDRAGKVQRVADWRLHDLRRTVATVMADKLAVLPHVIEATLNHVGGHKAGVAGIYNRALYEHEVRAALLLWADHIQAVVQGIERKVLPLRSA